MTVAELIEKLSDHQIDMVNVYVDGTGKKHEVELS